MRNYGVELKWSAERFNLYFQDLIIQFNYLFIYMLNSTARANCRVNTNIKKQKQKKKIKERNKHREKNVLYPSRLFEFVHKFIKKNLSIYTLH
jgi:hypothetical protein